MSTFRVDGALHHGHQFITYRQTETGAFIAAGNVAVPLFEATEKTGFEICRKADARVDNGELKQVSLSRYGHVDVAFIRELDRIRQDVSQYLFQSDRIGIDPCTGLR